MVSLKLTLAAALLSCPGAALADPLDRWAGDIARASARFDIPESWIRKVMRAESGGRTHFNGRPVISSAGAMGLMQLMPATWADMRSRLGLGPDPHDPADNILAGSLYLRLMYDRFGYPGLFAAYNAGPARYAAALNGGRRLPLETRSYVARIAGDGGTAPEMERRPTPRPDRLFAVARASSQEPATGAPSERPGPLFVQLGESRP